MKAYLGGDSMEYEIAGVPIVIGLVEVIKKAELFPNRFLPALAVLFGIAYALTVFTIGGKCIFQGIIIGLAAQGLYRGSKVTFNGK